MRVTRTKNGYVVLVHDHDKEKLDALLRRGGKVVGWVNGYYRVWMPREKERR